MEDMTVCDSVCVPIAQSLRCDQRDRERLSVLQCVHSVCGE